MDKYEVRFKNGQIGTIKGDTYVEGFDNRDEALAKRKSMNKILTPGERKHYGMKYYLMKNY